MPTLSLAMIVKDEAANLPRCLASVRGLVDEVVVVDTGSTDDTVAIAKSFQAHVHPFPWIDDFSAARNESLRHCRGDWVLILDADEAIDPQDHGIIRSVLDQKAPSAFNLVLRNYLLDGNQACMDVFPQPNDGAYALGADFPYHADAPGLRLCRLSPDLAFEGRIHEALAPYFLQRKLPIGALRATIHHFGKVDLAREAEKKVAYLRMAEAQVEAHPRSPQAWLNLLVQAALGAQWSRAVAAGEAFLRLETHAPVPVLTTLAMAYQETGSPMKGIPLLRKVLASDPGHRLALVLLPSLLLRARQPEKAVLAFQFALRSLPGETTLHLGLAEAHLALGHSTEALEAIRAALKESPGQAILWDRLVHLRLAAGQHAQAAADAWEALSHLPQGGEGHWQALVAAFLLQAGQVPQGLAILEKGLALHPAHEGLRRLAQAGGKG